MCVIICKPSGVKMPSENILRAAARANHDGFGFISTNGRSIKTMDFDEFYHELKKTTKDEEVLIHFRWATHGSCNPKNCHPFYDEDTDTWFAHNGVLPIPSENDMTDSEICFRNTIVPAIKEYGYLSDEMQRITNSVRGGSRFAFMKDGVISIEGSYTELHGCWYSNLNFLPFMRSYKDFWVTDRKELKKRSNARKKAVGWQNVGGVKIYDNL